MLEAQIISIFAVVALAVSLVTATSALYLKRKVGPLVDKANEFLETKPLEQLNETMAYMKKFAATAPPVMLDTVEGILDDKIDDLKIFANEYGQQGVAMVTGILQGEGASYLGKKGREASLANAQIKAGKEKLMRQAIQAQLPEGLDVEMVEGFAEQYGYTLEDAQKYLPLIQRFMGGGGHSPTPPNTPPLPSGEKLW